MAPAHLFQSALALSDLLRFYLEVRHTGEALGEPLSDADATVQSMPDASSARVAPRPYYPVFYPVFRGDGALALPEGLQAVRREVHVPIQLLLRDARGAAATSKAWHGHAAGVGRDLRVPGDVDQAHSGLLNSRPTRNVADLIELGRHHEQQHQQLLLTDILHVFAQNPIRPAYRDPAPVSVETAVLSALFFTDFEGGIVEIGHDGAGFAFDSAGPRNRVSTEPFRLADRLVTNAEWVEFIEDGGYTKHLLWLSGGWAKVLAEGWSKPLYWQTREGQQWTVTLRGFHWSTRPRQSRMLLRG